jgi:hypothetical protein
VSADASSVGLQIDIACPIGAPGTCAGEAVVELSGRRVGAVPFEVPPGRYSPKLAMPGHDLDLVEAALKDGTVTIGTETTPLSALPEGLGTFGSGWVIWPRVAG